LGESGDRRAVGEGVDELSGGQFALVKEAVNLGIAI
jgi:hypothetical protein